MTKQNTRSKVIQKHNKRNVPLYTLRMSDVVKIISNSPRRLEELWGQLEDRDRHIRDRAAATLAQLVFIHPSRLMRCVPRLRESLLDESAYVRWHIVCTIGILMAQFPSRLKGLLPDLLGSLQDKNRIVRVLSAKALAQVAVRNPRIIKEAFKGIEKDMPSIVIETLRYKPAKKQPGQIPKEKE